MAELNEGEGSDPAMLPDLSELTADEAYTHRTLSYTFRDLFRFFLNECGAIAVGIMRMQGRKNQHPYVMAAPSPMLRLSASDRCYVLVKKN